jgi:presequence protease
LLKAHLLSGVLLDNSASPLRQALETTELGSAPSPLCGLEDSSREMSLHAAASRAATPDMRRRWRPGARDPAQVARDGVPLEQVESVLHQLELSASGKSAATATPTACS